MARGRHNQRVSTLFKLKRIQATLDFVDVDVSKDTKVFVSPRALTLMHTDWGDGCVSLVQNFFETVLQSIKEGDHAGAEALLRELREPNETHLGMSRAKSRGRALGDGSAHDVWGALSRSAAAKSGLVQDLEDTVLLIHRVGVDIVSDITTNIIRGPLIDYTQEQCRQLGIPLTEGVPSGPMWHPGHREWITQFVELPMTPTGKLLLVPKAIVRRTSLYDMQEYYRHFMLEHMQREELRASKWCAVVPMICSVSCPLPAISTQSPGSACSSAQRMARCRSTSTCGGCGHPVHPARMSRRICSGSSERGLSLVTMARSARADACPSFGRFN